MSLIKYIWENELPMVMTRSMNRDQLWKSTAYGVHTLSVKEKACISTDFSEKLWSGHIAIYFWPIYSTYRACGFPPWRKPPKYGETLTNIKFLLERPELSNWSGLPKISNAVQMRTPPPIVLYPVDRPGNWTGISQQVRLSWCLHAHLGSPVIYSLCEIPHT